MSNEQQQLLSSTAASGREVAARPRRKKGPTIHDVAQECGVSAMSVSAVLNNRRGEVSPTTRERILQEMSRLNYQPSAAARALSRKRTDTIGIVLGIVGAVESVTNPYMAGVVSGALAAAKAHGYDVNIVTRDWFNTEQSAKLFNDERTDGILLIAPSQNSDIVEGLQALGRPIVTISGGHSNGSVMNVDVDDSKVASLAVTHLAALGHLRIAHITGDIDLASSANRLAGYKTSLIEMGIAVSEDYIAKAAYSGLGAGAATEVFMALAAPPTAIICGNDLIAFEVISTLRKMGIDVPRDVSVVGVDDVSAAALITPPLTTIRQPLNQIGFRAADMLIASIDGRAPQDVDKLITPELIVRSSTSTPTSF